MPAGKLFAWRRALASEHGPKSTTRLVLLTLSLHMNRDGGSCFPSTVTLATETGLSERAVCTHLDLAEKAGWIAKHQAGVSGKGWARNGYTATMPVAVILALKEVQCQDEGTEPDDEGTERRAEGTEPDDTKALKEVQSRTSSNSSENSSGEGERARAKGGPYENAAVRAYTEATSYTPQMPHADAIARRFPNPSASDLTAWTEHVTTWAVTDRWNERNVPTLILAFDEQSERQAPQRGAYADERDRAAAARADPIGTFQRNALAALAAIDPGHPGLGGPGQAGGGRVGGEHGGLDG